MGIVRGKEQLESFLEMAGIDRYIISYGEPFVHTFRSTAFEHSPKQIANDLEKGFQTADELRIRILRGETLSEAEHSHLSGLPKSWTVCSSSVTTDEGVERIRSWFKANKALAGTTSTKLCRLLRGNAQVFHEREDVLADGLVGFIDGTPVLRLSAHLGFTDACQDGTKNLFP
jgi:hypothetical protein